MAKAQDLIMLTIDGTHSFSAPRDLIWTLLRDPAVNKAALPGGERFESQPGSSAFVTLRIAVGPLKGVYDGRVTVVEQEMPHTVNLELLGTGEGTAYSGSGRLTLTEKNGCTLLAYSGEVAVSNHLGHASPRLLQTTANALVRQYLTAIDREVQQRVGRQSGFQPDTTLPAAKPRAAATIGMGDWLAEARRDRRIAAFAVLSGVIGSLSILGAVFVLREFGRWSVRRHTRRVATLLEGEST